jgi:hypothetical protein
VTRLFEISQRKFSTFRCKIFLKFYCKNDFKNFLYAIIQILLLFLGRGVCSIFLHVDRSIKEIHKNHFITKVFYKKYVLIVLIYY